MNINTPFFVRYHERRKVIVLIILHIQSEVKIELLVQHTGFPL